MLIGDGDREVVAQLAEEVGLSLLRFATRLRDLPSPDSSQRQAGTSLVGDDEPLSPPVKLGASQQRILEAMREGDGSEGGFTAYQVAKLTGLSDTNTPRILASLARRGLVHQASTTPLRWQLSEAASHPMPPGCSS